MFGKLSKDIENGKSGAVVTVTKSSGSTPADVGKMMIVYEDGSIDGTVGGGNLEKQTISIALDLLRKGKSEGISFDLTKDLGMNCGGSVELFIKIVKPDYRLILVGGGHIAFSLNKIAKLVNFRTVIFDDREDMLTEERFGNADETIFGDIASNLSKFNFNENDFIVIVTHGHKNDEDALFEVIDKNVKYIGVIGSKRKIKVMFDNLFERGISRESIEKVYSPIGLRLGGNSPEEVALSIISEIQLVKTGAILGHMKDGLSIT
jgi:xanthine dehydrogenase accessory factor